jgi:adenine-specific DNA methylase
MTSARYPRRLIEVDLPIKRISAHSRREKSIRHGHISTLHIWWARRPLAACRAVICAALWPDPADDLCPEKFRQVAREWMLRWAQTPEYMKRLSADSYSRFNAINKKPKLLDNNEELRKALFERQ